jgi:SAM-dependent MidA family methyltransferase
MELALYAPGLGYYSGGRRVLGHRPQDGSDFVTAPELTPLFGEVLARQVAQALHETGTREIWEFGAGTGALAEQLLGELGDQIDRYVIVDLSGALRERQHQRLLKARPELVDKVIWADSLPEELNGVIVGNEVLDAMPVHLLSWDGQRWLERGVSLGDSPERPLQWADRPAPEGVRPPTEHPDAAYAPGTVTETHGQAEAFVATLAQRMVKGAAFFLDYGFPEREYFLPDRRGGTLMCHHAHTADPDPLSTSQGRFLTNCGLGEAMARCAQPSSLEEVKARAALQMLVAEHEMGELFKVIGFVKGPWFDAIGFQHGDRTHTL